MALLGAEERNNAIIERIDSAFNINTLRLDLLSLGWFQQACRPCFSFMAGSSLRSVNRRVSDWSDGVNLWTRENAKKEEGRYSEKGANARLWLEALRDELGDQCPDSPDLYLPPGTKSDYYKEYAAEVKTSVKLETFLLIWRKEFPNLKIPRQKRLGKCKVCAELKEKLATEQTPQRRAELKQQRRDHLMFVRLQRKYYHRNRKMAQDNPDNVLVIILDGMDKEKSRLPSFFEHDGREAAKLNVRIIGAIVHGRAKPFYAWLVTQFTSETNTNIACLLQVHYSSPSSFVLDLCRHWLRQAAAEVDFANGQLSTRQQK